jgi:thiol:disulfide interchange protein
MTDYGRRNRKMPKGLSAQMQGAFSEHQITDREKRAWQASKERQPVAHPELTREQIKRFAQLVAELRSPVYFERDLGLNRAGVEFYKRKLNIDSQDEARGLLRKMNREDEEAENTLRAENTAKQREAERVAQQRLDELEAAKAAEQAEAIERKKREVDPNRVKQEDAERQKRFEKQQEEKLAATTSVDTWRLNATNQDQVQLFKWDLEERGWTFCIEKYGASSQELKAEAIRLGLKINWDVVKR